VEAQVYANHVHRPRAWTITVVGALTAVVLLAWSAYAAPSPASVGLVILALVVASTISLLRVFALRLQNRIIRLEMRVRLTKLGRDGEMDRLAVSQLVALRFASDLELPSLFDRALAESLSADQIKRAVTDWQADFFRT
jgi:hypothetical protein